MRLAASLLALVAATPLASAQQTALSEDFSGAQFPPAGWTQVQLGPNTNGWARDAGGQRAWHEDFTGSNTENYLISPPIDLSGFTAAYLHFEGETNYATYLANHPTSNGDGVSNVEVTTDGGLTWTILWTDTSENNGSYGPTLDLTAYAGMTNVQIGFYFYGTFAQEWWVDNVIVDDTPVPVLTTVTNPTTGNPYFLLGQSDFATAQAMAISLGGNLVSIENVQENNWVKNQFSNWGGTNRNLLLGLNDVASEDNFTWVSGEAFLYDNFATGQPDDAGPTGEDYVQMTPNGEWNDFDGSGAYGVVEISEPRILTTPLVAGQLATITVNGLRVGAEVVLVFSVNGAGPSNTPFGVLEVDLDMISPRFPAISGQYNFSTLIPSSLSGRTLYGQGVQFNSDGSTDLSSPFAEPIQ